MEGAGDVVAATKYQKLAKVYAELKQKNQVLKSAVSDLTTRNADLEAKQSSGGDGGTNSVQLQGQIKALQSAVTERDQKIRSMTQQVDSLQFHNQQLSKRVEVFQQEASDKKSGGGGKKKRSAAAEEALALQEEELRRKIMENEQVHRSMAELKRQSEGRIRQLTEQLRAISKELEATKKSSANQEKESSGKMKVAEEEKEILSKRLAALEEQSQQNTNASSDRVRNLESELAKQKALVQQVNETVSNKMTFNDTAVAGYNQYNIPPINGKRESDVKQVKQRSREYIKLYSSNFSNFLTYMEERVQALQYPTGSPGASLASALNGHAAYLKPLDRTFSTYAEGSSDLTDFLSSLKVLSMYFGSFSGCFRAFAEAEAAAPSCPPGLAAANSSCIADIAGIENAYRQLVELVGSVTSGNIGQDAEGGVNTIVEVLEGFESKHVQLCQSYEATLALANADDSTLAINKDALLKTAEAASGLHNTLRDNLGVLTGGGKYSVRGVPAMTMSSQVAGASVKDLQTRAKKFMDTLLCDAPDSVPYSEALSLKSGTVANMPTSVIATSVSAGDSATVKALHDRIADLEMEREKSALELQLMTMKVKSLDVSGGISSTAGSAAGDSGVIPDATVAGGAEVDALKRHYEERIQLLTTQLQFADSKAVAYYDECRNTALRLEMLRNSQATQAEEHKNVNGTISRLKEDLETTKRNYEEQLNTMTEHIMVMNDRLQQKDAEVDVAKAKSKTKAAKGSTSRSSRRKEQQEDIPNFF